MKDEKPGQALMTTRAVQGEVVIASPNEFRSFLQAHDTKRFNVLTPQTDFGALPPQWTVVPSIVKLDPNPNAGDVYEDRLFCKGGEVAPTKMGLRKLARAGGISWKTTRVDSNTVLYYWSVSATISYRGFDGQMKEHEASYEWDLRDGSPRTVGMSANELKRARLTGLRRCEAGAINAAIREYGVKQKYTPEELAKPFVLFNLVFTPDQSDPQIRAMVAQAALTGTSLLYPSLPAHGGGVNHATGEIIDVMDANAPEPAADEDAPFTPGGAAPAEEKRPIFHITNVRRLGSNFYLATAETKDDKLFTDDQALASAAHAAWTGKLAVHLELEKRGDDRWVLEFAEAAKGGEKL